MNANTVFEVIGKELNISRYAGESTRMLHARVAYSALGMWIKTLSAAQTKEEDFLSKASLHRKVATIIHNFIKVDHELAKWFYPSEKSNPENIIRDVLLRCGNIIEQGFDSKICCEAKKNVRIDDTSALIIGYSSAGEFDFVTGLACVVNGNFKGVKNDLNDEFQIPLLNAKNQLEIAEKRAKWEKLNKIDNLEFFDPTRKKVLSSCWIPFLPLVSNQIYIARSRYTFGMHDYFLAKRENGTNFISNISEYSRNPMIRDTQRLLYAVKSVYGVSASALVERGLEYSIWHFWSKLPPAEEAVLRYIGWPLENIDNPKNEFVIRNEFSALIESIGKNLDIKMEEGTHE